MNRYSARISKLESRLGINQDSVVVFKSIVHGDSEPLSKSLHSALVMGVGRIVRGKDEQEADFARRAYAMVVSGKRVDDMSDEELLVNLAAADKQIAFELAKTANVSDALLHEAAGADVVESGQI